MKKFKTIVGRAAYTLDFDKKLSETVSLVDGKVDNIHFAMSDSRIIAVVEYETKAKGRASGGTGKASTTKA